MSNRERFEQLWNDYLEGELQEDRMAELQELLASDDKLLRDAADGFQVHRLLGLKAEDNDARHEHFVRATMEKLPSNEKRVCRRLDAATASAQVNEASTPFALANPHSRGPASTDVRPVL